MVWCSGMVVYMCDPSNLQPYFLWMSGMVWYHLPTTLDILSICPRTVHASLLVWNHDSRILLLIDVVIRYGTRDSHNAYKQCHKCSLQSANTKVGHRF